MRATSGRAAAAAMLLVGLAVLAVAGRLLPSAPEHPAPGRHRHHHGAGVRPAPGNTRA